MKRIILLIIVIATAISSCKKDNDLLYSNIITDKSIDLNLKDTFQINLEEGLLFTDIQFSTSDSSILTITQDGLVFCKSGGTALVLAEYKNISDQMIVTIDDQYLLACVIRKSDSGSWYAINDQGHSPIGVDSITEDNVKITIYYDFEASKVHTFNVTPDETFSGLGVTAGASVDLTKVRIYLTQMIEGRLEPIDPTKLINPAGNFWVYGLFAQ